MRSERLLMEQLDYNLLFRWFVGLNMDDAVWDPTVFTKNRERLLAGDIAQAFFARVLAQARQRGLLSDEHFTVDGTLIEAWASLKSFKPKDAPSGPPPDDPGNPTVDFHGERRSNVTHGSTTDPDARLFRKGKGHEAKLVYLGHVLMENRHGLAVEGCVTRASGYGERAAALEMLTARSCPRPCRGSRAGPVELLRLLDIGQVRGRAQDGQLRSGQRGVDLPRHLDRRARILLADDDQRRAAKLLEPVGHVDLGDGVAAADIAGGRRAPDHAADTLHHVLPARAEGRGEPALERAGDHAAPCPWPRPS